MFISVYKLIWHFIPIIIFQWNPRTKSVFFSYLDKLKATEDPFPITELNRSSEGIVIVNTEIHGNFLKKSKNKEKV